MIFVSQSKDKDVSNQCISTKFTQVESLAAPYPDVKALIQACGNFLPHNAIDGSSWLLTNCSSADKIKQMESKGIPLGQYIQGGIYRGILTGFNQAFILDRETRDQIISKDPASEEIIKPLLVGDDVRKWYTKDKDKWLIVTPVGIDIKKYPAIFKHLQQWQPQLEKRCDKGNYWWELRSCAYYAAFDQPKIIFPDIAKESRFTFDVDCKYLSNTSYCIPGKDLYLLGILNSSSVWDFCKEKCSVIGDADKNGRLRLIRQSVEIIPIPQASEIEQKAISKLVQKCLDAKGVGCEAWEKEIDIRVAKLYGFDDNYDLN